MKEIKKELENTVRPYADVARFLADFVRSPIQIIKKLPPFDWVQVLLLQTIVASISGFSAGALSGSLLSMFGNILFYPISSILLHSLGAIVLQFLLKHSQNLDLNFLSLYFLLVVVNIPAFALRVLTGLGMPVAPISLAVSMMLLTVALVEVYKLEKNKVLKWMAIFYTGFIIVWIAHRVSTDTNEYSSSLDELKIEISSLLRPANF